MIFSVADLISRYWSEQQVATNLLAFLNIAGAMFLGLFVGYERSFNGRAAGMRTYGLVCMASCALIVLAGSPTHWYGGAAHGVLPVPVSPDPTRIIQGVVTGVGFLGAGVIMKDGFSISGLTTAASIWASSAIGILVGIGFYATAILVTVLSTILMIWVMKLEHWLPAKQAVSITIRFRHGFTPQENILKRIAKDRGYEILPSTLNIRFDQAQQEWRYIAIAENKDKAVPISVLANELKNFDGVDQFNISHSKM
jgi:putative Mg2+ transporter-C (MgtC) family protein